MGLADSDIRTYLTEICPLLPDGTLDDGLMSQAIKRATKDLAQSIDLTNLQTQTTVTIVSGTSAYDFSEPSEFDRIRVVTFIGADDARTSLEETDDRSIEIAIKVNQEEANPTNFALWGNSLKVYPIPNQAGTLYVDWLKKISAVEDIDDKYFHFFVNLCKLDIYEEGTPRWLAVYKDLDRQFGQLKGQQQPYKARTESTPYRKDRLRIINAL